MFIFTRPKVGLRPYSEIDIRLIADQIRR